MVQHAVELLIQEDFLVVELFEEASVVCVVMCMSCDIL